MNPSVAGSTDEKWKCASENIRDSCQQYPSQKVHFVCIHINYTEGHKCCKLNVSLSSLQQGLFVWLPGMLSIRQTRFMLLFCREVVGFSRASVWCSCMCVVLHGSAQVAGGRMVILSPQMDRKNPGGIWKATGNVVYILCVYVCVAFVYSSIFSLSVADRSSTTPLSCNKCHPCLLGFHSKSSDQSHTNTHIYTNIHI